MRIYNFLTIKDIPATFFISFYADFLKKGNQVELPSWLSVVKTNFRKTKTPSDSCWFFYKLASLVRKFYINKNIKKNIKKKTHLKGKITRFALQQLEKIKIIEKHNNGFRILTKKAQQDVNDKIKKIHKLFLETKNR